MCQQSLFNDSMCQCFFENESPKRLFFIRQVSYQTAMKIVIENHYLHRKAPCSVAYGLFCNSCQNIAGVIVYGTPSSSSLRVGICGEDESFNVIELTRLWVIDGTPKNTESYFIGNTLPLINKEIIVSYAEINQGHIGVVYQASNWIYTGLSAKRTNWSIEGINKHSQTIADKYTSEEIKRIYGNRFKLVDRPRKHRYIYFNASKKRKKELLQKLKYKIQPYPKSINE